MITISVLIFLIVMDILVMVHEGGHFFAAKLSGVKVIEFAIGMGPQLIKKQGKKITVLPNLFKKSEDEPLNQEMDQTAEQPDENTTYALRLLPIGGFVKMEGEDEESEDERSFFKKPVYKKIFIVTAGALMNLVLGFLIMLFLTVYTAKLPSTTIAGFTDGAVSSTSGLQVNDSILKIDNSSVHTYSDIPFTLTLTNKDSVKLTVLRDGKKVVLDNVKFPKVTSGSVTGLDTDFKVFAAKKTPLFVLKESFFRTVSVVKTVWVSFIKIVTGAIGVDNMSGPVGITSAVGQATSYGFLSLLTLVAFITVNLGVVNLLPLPALDGGRFIFLLIEAVRRKPVPQKYEGMVHFVGFALLMVLLVFLTYNDILRLIGK